MQEAQPYSQDALSAVRACRVSLCRQGLTLELLAHDLPLLHQEPVFPANKLLQSAPHETQLQPLRQNGLARA